MTFRFRDNAHACAHPHTDSDSSTYPNLLTARTLNLHLYRAYVNMFAQENKPRTTPMSSSLIDNPAWTAYRTPSDDTLPRRSERA
jgi:hypothetical protein